MSFLFKNNAGSTLAAGINASQTTLSVQGGDGAKFPSPAGGDTFRATIVKSDGTFEIVDVTARSTDSFTIVRNQEGSGAKTFLAGDRIDLRVTQETLEEFAQINGGTVNPSLNADQVDGIDAVTTAQANKLLALNGSSKLPASITGDAETVDGIHASASATNNQLLALNGSGVLPASITGASTSCSGNAATATLATDSSKLGAVVAASYARKDIAQTHSGDHTFSKVIANGELELNAGYSEDDDALAASGSITINTAVATFFHTATLTGVPTFSFTNPASSGRVTSFTLELNNAGGFNPVWPAAVEWAKGIEPVWSSGKDIVSFVTRDGGSSWTGHLGGLDFS